MKTLFIALAAAAVAACYMQPSLSQDIEDTLREIRDQQAQMLWQQQQQEQRAQPQNPFLDSFHRGLAAPEQLRNSIERNKQLQLQNEILAQCLELMKSGAPSLPAICNNVGH